MKIKVIIGANYGDEGKGLATNYWSHNLAKNDEFYGTIILNNGGAQRGHTVETEDGFRHVFHHFGSTNNKCWRTYCYKDFIINPAIWNKERMELAKLGLTPETAIHPDCIVSTPFDMILNQLVTLSNKTTGSVGVGIWETIKRQEDLPTKYNTADFYDSTFKHSLITYFQKKCDEYQIDPQIKADFLKDINLEKLYDHFLYDFVTMKNHCPTATLQEIKDNSHALIIENGQGLLLDKLLDKENNTPSNTGSDNIISLLSEIQNEYDDVETCYVSRTYLTRHGDGPLEGEVSHPNKISEKIEVDLTNITSVYQGSIRYGKLDIKTLIARLKTDAEKYNKLEFSKNCKQSLFLTHINETEYNFMKIISNTGFNFLKHGYLSDSKFYSNINKIYFS